MKKGWKAEVCLALLGAVALPVSIAAPLPGKDPGREWSALVDEYLEKVYFPQNPTTATVAGIHKYDGEIEAYSAEGIAADNRLLHEYEARVASFPVAGLGQVDAADRQILLGYIRSELLTSEGLRPQEKNPDIYSSGAAGTVYPLMVRKFCASGQPAAQRNRARAEDSRDLRGGAEEPEESRADLYGDRHRTDSRDHQFL